MTYIVVALKSEAQAFVDKYKLKKEKLGNFTIFTNETIMLIVSGIGVINSRMATQTLINHFDITDDDTYLNVGICGADRRYEIGSLLEIGKLIYLHEEFKLHSDTPYILSCVNEEIATEGYEIVDMESYGFYDAVMHSPAIKNYHILKVVSDHFKPQTVTKEGTKSLIFNQIDAINEILNQKVHS